MAAMGINQPSAPFFFIHEYKPEEPRGSTDGRGQLLAMMLTSQILNDHPSSKVASFPWIKVEKNQPVYGTYVIGGNWYFLVLQGKASCMSKAFDATEEGDLLSIFGLLKVQRELIVGRIRALRERV